jgi:hypothetical protein
MTRTTIPKVQAIAFSHNIEWLNKVFTGFERLFKEIDNRFKCKVDYLLILSMEKCAIVFYYCLPRTSTSH